MLRRGPLSACNTSFVAVHCTGLRTRSGRRVCRGRRRRRACHRRCPRTMDLVSAEEHAFRSASLLEEKEYQYADAALEAERALDFTCLS
eukprot:4995331-Prymnesium_polylepis.2